MDVPGNCANCGATLPADQPPGHGYCVKCAAAWQRGNGPKRQGDRQGETESVSTHCTNCGITLPTDQPAGHNYCSTCAAAWHKGRPSR
jgi:hypothetical protein